MPELIDTINFPPIPAPSRRDFLQRTLYAGCGIFCGSLLTKPIRAQDAFPEETQPFVIEARYYEKLDHKKIRCKLCPRECVIDDRERGYCGVRENRGGTYYSLVYARPCAMNADPIEKKPLFHFLPGSRAFSIATAGCNVNCKFCQNWEISQVRPEEVRSVYMPPDKIARAARNYDCRSIAYTYSEPTIFFEFMEDTALAGRSLGVKSVVVTAGYINQEPLLRLCALVDAIKVDLKAFSQSYYTNYVNGELKPVLDSLITMRGQGMWTEIVYLVVPGLNDTDEEFTALTKWILEYLGKDVPVHFTRFHPQYLLKNLPPTPVRSLERAKAIADAAGMHYVYIGNVPGHPAENTRCPVCGKVVIARTGFIVTENNISGGKCRFCSASIAGIWT